MFVAGNPVRHKWLFLDSTGGLLSGMAAPADITFKLFKDSGAGFVAASEAVPATAAGTWGEISGQPGNYNLQYTPNSPGTYQLDLQELNPSSDGKRWTFPVEVVSAGAVFLPAFSNAFCAESDVARWTQLAFGTVAKPTSTEVAGFAQSRASEIRSVLASVGWVVAPSDVSLIGTVQSDMLREVNAIGAAADAWMAKFMDTEPARTEKAVQLLEEYQVRLTRLMDYAKKVLGSIQIRTHVSSGEVTLPDEGNITDGGMALGIRYNQEF